MHFDAEIPGRTGRVHRSSNDVLLPAMMLFLIAGLLITWEGQRAGALFYVLVIVLMLLWPLWMTPKEILLFVPVLVMCIAAGVHFLWNIVPKTRSIVVRGLVLTVLLLPWFVGIRAKYGDTAWGPGFELQRFDRPYNQSNAMALTLGPGAAVPTREGPRPLFGHAYCLLGGGWRNFVRDQSRECRAMISHALTSGIPLMTVGRSTAFIIAVAAEQSFRTQDPPARFLPPDSPEIRTLVSPPGDSLMLVRQSLLHSRHPDRILRTLRSRLQTERVVVFDFSSTLRTIYQISPNSLEPIGNASAVLDLRTLERDWRRRP